MDNKISRILVVDDDSGWLATMSDVLKFKGFEPACAQTGSEALARLAERDFDAALIDLHLGDMSGLDVLSAIKTRSPETECILLTGHATQDSAVKALQMNAFGYFQKPIDMEQILLSVQRAVEKRQSTRALRASEERLHLATNTGNIGVWDWDVVKDELTWEDSMYVLYGICKEDWGGAYEAWNHMLHPDDRQYADGEIQAALRGERAYAPEFRIVHPDGEVRILKAASQTLYDKDGKALRMIGTNMDITARKQAEGALLQAMEKSEENEVKFEAITNQTTEGIALSDLDGNYVFVNPAFCNMMGYSGEELLKMTVFDVKAKTQPHSSFFESKTEKEGQPIEVNLQRKDGNEFFTEIIGRVIKINGTDFVLGTVRDISERKQAAEALMLAYDQAVKANQLKSQLIAKVSHELRTPLSSVLGFAELLKYNIFGGELNEQQIEAADQIIDSAHYLTDMVSEFLDEAEIETKSLVLEHKALIPAEILKHVKATMSIIADKKGLALTTHLASDLPETLWGDARRLQQILINLTNNAIKFTRAGEVSVSMLRRSENQWALQVKDTGVGIPKDAQEMIFEPFKQIDNAITREQQGTGLGLTITKQLINLMSGRIIVESDGVPGKGSIFTVILPIQTGS